MLFDPEKGGAGLEQAMSDLCRRASEAVAAGYDILILSDRGVGPKLAPIPSLMATAGVHHHLVREGTRTRCGLVVESGDAREVHHVSLLMGYGAGVVNPYLAFETIDDMIAHGLITGVTREDAIDHYVKALNKGILKVMSKMGISTLASYCGAQIFEAIGLNQEFIDRFFTHTTSRVGGVGIDVIAKEACLRHERAFGRQPAGVDELEAGRRIPVAPRRRVSPLQSGHRLQAAARDAQRPVLDLQGVHARRRSAEPESRDAARAVPAEAGGPGRPDRRGRAGRRRSSSGSPPARCRTARSATRRTRRWPLR